MIKGLSQEIKAFAQKLRNAAASLDELIGVDRPTGNENVKTANKIRKTLKKKRVKKNRSYNGNHWTQTPAGKKKLARQQRRVWRAKKKAEKS